MTATPGGVAFTAEQRAAIDDRAGSALLAANAGSGKTAVMAERCVEAVLQRRGPGRLDPRPHLHREGGGRAARPHPPALHRARRGGARARGRRGLDRHDPRLLRARAARAAARRRARPALRGARRGRRRAARARRLRAAPSRPGPRRAGAAAVDVAAAFGAGLRDIVLAAHSTLRSRGRDAAGPAGPAARRRDPDPAELAAARAEAARCLATAGSGKRLEEALDALESCERVLGASGGVPVARRARRCRAQEGARRRSTQPPCAAYRAAWTAYRQGCADHHARLALVEIADLLDALQRRLRGGQGRPRGPRLRGPRARRPRPARRRRRRPRALGRALPADHGRRVPGHEPAPARHPARRSSATTCSRSATSSSRSTASATPT